MSAPTLCASLAASDWSRHAAFRALLRVLLLGKEAERRLRQHTAPMSQQLSFFAIHRAWAFKINTMVAELDDNQLHYACCPVTECNIGLA